MGQWIKDRARRLLLGVFAVAALAVAGISIGSAPAEAQECERGFFIIIVEPDCLDGCQLQICSCAICPPI